jgi:hypothetical protein
LFPAVTADLGARRPDDGQLREALYGWAFRDRHDPPEEVAAVLGWVADHSRPLADLANPDVILDVLDAIASKLDGSAAAANAVARKRAVLSNVLDYGIGRGLDANPLPQAAKMWTPPRTIEGVVDLGRLWESPGVFRFCMSGRHGHAVTGLATRALRLD